MTGKFQLVHQVVPSPRLFPSAPSLVLVALERMLGAVALHQAVQDHAPLAVMHLQHITRYVHNRTIYLSAHATRSHRASAHGGGGACTCGNTGLGFRSFVQCEAAGVRAGSTRQLECRVLPAVRFAPYLQQQRQWMHWRRHQMGVRCGGTSALERRHNTTQSVSQCAVLRRLGGCAGCVPHAVRAPWRSAASM